MIDVIKITESHWLTRVPVPVPSTSTAARSKVNHIWIYDRSGSMTWLLPELAEDLIAHYQTVPIGDIISLGYFSGVGVYRFILKGFVKTSKDDEATFANIVRQNKSSIGTTCFSEIMYDASKVVSELAPICNNFALMFFTDGYPVVPDYLKEIRDLFDAIDRIKGLVSRAIFVGYGDYYNRELMQQMTARAGGQLIHSSSLPEFSTPMSEFVGAQIAPRILIPVPTEVSGILTAFTTDVMSHTITQYEVNKNAVAVDAVCDNLYLITTAEPKVKDRVKSFEIEDGMYAAALIFSQRLQADQSLSVLSRLGDVAIIDDLNSAFTNDEFGRVENSLRECVFDVNLRYKEGHRLGYVPRKDRFCLLNLLETLQADDQAKFYPYDPSFEYHRIGTKTKTKEGYPEFHRDEKNPGCPVTTLTWNETRMNISLQARIPGHVTLSDECAGYGFAKEYPTWVYRNFAIVQDGSLNMQTLPVSCSQDTHAVLVKTRLVSDKAWAQDKVFQLKLKKIPIMNRAIADDAMTANQLCDAMTQEKWMEAKIKVFKWLKEKLDPEKLVSTTPLSDEQKKYLETQGIGYNGFSPAKEELPPTDFYMAKEFSIKMAKFSSLPAVEKVLAKASDKLTPAEFFIFRAVQDIPADVWNAQNEPRKEVRLAVLWLTQAIENARKSLYGFRNRMYRTKASVILGKRWFPDLSVREGAEVSITNSLGEFSFTFTMKDIKVEL